MSSFNLHQSQVEKLSSRILQSDLFLDDLLNNQSCDIPFPLWLRECFQKRVGSLLEQKFFLSQNETPALQAARIQNIYY